MRAVIAEDSVLLREGVERVLGDAGFDVRGAYGSADELLEKLEEDAPDVAIIDIRLPPTHSDEGLRAALDIRSRARSVGVLVLSQYVEIGLAMKLLADSAEGAARRRMSLSAGAGWERNSYGNDPADSRRKVAHFIRRTPADRSGGATSPHATLCVDSVRLATGRHGPRA